MDSEQVVEKILSDAKAEAVKIKKLADEETAAQQSKLNGELTEYNEQTKILAEKAAAEKKSHMLAAARMSVAMEHLAEKRKILDDVFVKSRASLREMPDDEYRRLMAKLMVEAVESGNEEVIIDHNETRIDQELINQVNGKLPSGRNGNLRLSEQRENLGAGFILRDGKIKINVSLEVLLEQARRELEIELAKELF